MRVLVTGGAGFIGSHVVRRLLKNSHEAVILDDFSTGLQSNIEKLDVEVHQTNLADFDSVAKAMHGVEAVVHLGARGSVPRSIIDPVASHHANATGTVHVLEAARAIGAYVVFASSSSVYGANSLTPKIEQTWTQPMSPYAASKLAGEGYAFGYQNSYETQVLVLRLFNVFGPSQRPDHEYAAVIPKWLFKIMTGQTLTIHGDGLQTRDFTFVDSVVDVIVDALHRRVNCPSPVNLAFGQSLSLLDLLARMEDLLGKVARVDFSMPRPGDVQTSRNNPAKLHSMFPSVKPPNFDMALGCTADWIKNHYSL